MNVWVALCSFGKSSLGPKASTHLNLETNSTVLEAPWEPGGDLVSSVSRRPAPKLDLVTLSFWDRWDVGFYSDHSSSKLTHHKMPLQIYLLKSSWNIISPLHRNQGSAKFEKSEKLDRSRWDDAICAYGHLIVAQLVIPFPQTTLFLESIMILSHSMIIVMFRYGKSSWLNNQS